METIFVIPNLMMMSSVLSFYRVDLPMQPYSLYIAKMKMVIKYMMILLYVLFIGNALWLFVSCEGQGKTGCEFTWLDHLLSSDDVPTDSSVDVFIFSLYRVTSLLTAGGVGDINPHTLTEQFVATILMLLGFLGSGYLQAMVTSHLRAIANEKDVSEKRLSNFIATLQANNVK